MPTSIGCAAGRGLAAAIVGVLWVALSPSAQAAPQDVAAARREAADRVHQRAPLDTAAATAEGRDAALRERLDVVRRSPTCGSLTAAASRYSELGVTDTAMQYLAEALRIEPRCGAAHDESARLYRDVGAYQAALTSAHRATFFAPAVAAHWNTLGTVHQALGQVAFAAAAFRRVVHLDPSAAYGHNNLCYLAFQQGDFEGAATACARALEVDAEFAPAINNLALLRAAAGDMTSAYRLFEVSRGVASAHYNLGMVLLARRELPQALASFEAAYREDPRFDEAHAAARRTRTLLQRSAEKTGANNDRR